MLTRLYFFCQVQPVSFSFLIHCCYCSVKAFGKASAQNIINQLVGMEKERLIEHGKRTGINEILKQTVKHRMMLSYYLKCKKNTDSENPKISKTSNRKIIFLSNCAV